MTGPRARSSMLRGGLSLAVRHVGAVAWTYGFSLFLAILFSLSLHARLSAVLDHSMAAERLNAAFDLGTLGAVAHQLSYRTPTAGGSAYAGLPLYLLLYFVLVPGALYTYRIGAPQHLAILISSGLRFLWRFLRITLLTVLVCGFILGPLFALQNVWMNHVDQQVVGVSAIVHDLAGWLLIALVAAVLRVYFDLVEVYTVQLDDQYRENGKPDRRVRKVLIPAAKTLAGNFARLLGSFCLTTFAGLAVLGLTGRLALLMLARPHVWPAFLLLQLGFFFNTFCRFWMRAAETVLLGDFRLQDFRLTQEALVDSASKNSLPSLETFVPAQEPQAHSGFEG